MLEQRTFLHARSALALAASLSLTACFGTTEPDPDWLAGNSPKPDAGKGDSGAEHDAACADCDGGDHASPGRCDRSEDCGASFPHCGPASACVACLQSDHCSATTPVCSGNACVACTKEDEGACTSQSKVCETGGTRCVECNANPDCKDPTAARCETTSHQCVPCQDSSQCTHMDENLHVCSAGACVQCTPETEAEHCGENACDPQTLTCTTTKRTSLATCRACRADSECIANHKCVEVPFQGQSSGWFCMRQRPMGGCPLPYGGPSITTTSRSGSASAQYCAQNTNVVTCKATTSLTSGVQCTSSTVESDCGQGARCEELAVGPNRCTYACSSDLTCPADAPCNEESSDDPYCGGPSP